VKRSKEGGRKKNNDDALYLVFGIGMEQSAGYMPHAKLPAGIAAELRKHAEVAFFLWQCGKHVQKIYFHETCPGGFII